MSSLRALHNHCWTTSSNLIGDWVMRPQRWNARKAAILLSLWVAYIASFPLLYNMGGRGIAAVSVVLSIIGAWWLGWRGGLLSGLISIPLNLLLISLQVGGGFRFSFFDVGAGSLTLPTVGLIVGGLRAVLDRLEFQTAQIQRERATLAETEQRYRQISELTSDFVYLLRVDPTGVLEARWVTAAFQQITGYHPDELSGAAWNNLTHPEDRWIIQAHGARLFAGETSVSEYRLLRRDGSVRWVRDHARPIRDPANGAVVELLGAVSDITEHHDSQESLRQMMQQNLLLARAVSAASDGIVIADAQQPDLPLTYVNPAFTRITGYQPAEVLGSNCRFLQGPQTDRAVVRELSSAIAQYQEGRQVLLNYRKDGQPFWNDLRLAPVRDEQGQLLAYVGVQTDITARIQAEQALQASETMLRLITGQLPAVIWTVDTELRITSAMGADLRRVADADLNFVDQSLYTLFQTDDPELPPIAGHLQALSGISAVYELHLQGHDYDVRVEPLRDDGGQIIGCLSMGLDITERKRAEQELALAYDSTIEGWSRALDLRDKETEGHSQRVTELTMCLAQALELSAEELVHIRRGALLHDIGKMGIPDAILLKPGPLSDAEWAIMRMHPDYAFQLLSPISYLRPALDIPYCHHERWDGSGYPRGLRGEAIPLAARIFAVADVWDALCSDRPYRAGWPPERVAAHIASLSGIHFDPRVVEVFLQLVPMEMHT